jgi:aspartate/methionine/tyrosine aminotransferase
MAGKVIADRVSKLGGEGAFVVQKKVAMLRREGKKIVTCHIGQPDRPAPKPVVDAAIKALEDGDHGYTPSGGKLEMRETVAEWLTKTRGVEYNWEEICITPGAKPAIFLALLATIEAGDEVIYPDPGYPTYGSVIPFLGAIPKPLPLVEELGFRFQLDQLEKLITPGKTRMIILNSPENPTGGVLTEGDMKGIAELCHEYDLLVFSDEIYSQLIYGEKHHSIVQQPGMKERTIVMDGHSKTYAMPGWRLGFAGGTKETARAMELLMTNSNSCAASFTQTAGRHALMMDQAPVIEMREEFKRRKDMLVERLNAIDGITCHNPEGAFYVFPNVRSFGKSSDEIEEFLLTGAAELGVGKELGLDGVSILSGTAFGPFGAGYIRLSYANSYENLELAVEFMKEAFAKL